MTKRGNAHKKCKSFSNIQELNNSKMYLSFSLSVLWHIFLFCIPFKAFQMYVPHFSYVSCRSPPCAVPQKIKQHYKKVTIGGKNISNLNSLHSSQKASCLFLFSWQIIQSERGQACLWYSRKPCGEIRRQLHRSLSSCFIWLAASATILLFIGLWTTFLKLLILVFQWDFRARKMVK